MRRFTITVSDEHAQVLDALAHLDARIEGYTGRTGAWLAENVRRYAEAHRNDKSVVAALKNRESYQAARAKGGTVVDLMDRLRRGHHLDEGAS